MACLSGVSEWRDSLQDDYPTVDWLTRLQQDDGSLTSLEYKGSSKLKSRCQRALDIDMSRGSGFVATGMDVFWGANGSGGVVAIACSASADRGCR